MRLAVGGPIEDSQLPSSYEIGSRKVTLANVVSWAKGPYRHHIHWTPSDGWCWARPSANISKSTIGSWRKFLWNAELVFCCSGWVISAEIFCINLRQWCSSTVVFLRMTDKRGVAFAAELMCPVAGTSLCNVSKLINKSYVTCANTSSPRRIILPLK